jgi:hypothetical protein
VPIGVAIVYATRDVAWRFARIALYFAGACAFALALQIGQIYLPARIAALSDALWNGVGTALGLALARAVLPWLPRAAAHDDGYTALALLVIACWLGWRLWPFAPAFSLINVYHALKPSIFWRALNAWSVASMAVSLLLIASVVEGLRRPLRWLLGAACASLAVRLFLQGQAITASVWLGTLLGIAAGLVVLLTGIARARPWVMLIAMAWYSAESLRPFVFNAGRTAMQWVPFAALLRGSMDTNLASLAGAAFLSGALMLTGTRFHDAPGRWCVLLAAWLFLLEWAQQWAFTRTSDVTIVLLPLAWWCAIRLACGEAKAGA